MKVMNNSGIDNLISAIIMQAVKDYCRGDDDEKKTILKELRSPWMNGITGGRSIIVAEQLEKNCSDITARLIKYHEISEE